MIARAVAQYSPALMDVDLLPLVRAADPIMLIAVTMRETLSVRLVDALLDRHDRDVALKLLGRPDTPFGPGTLLRLAEEFGRARTQKSADICWRDPTCLPP